MGNTKDELPASGKMLQRSDQWRSFADLGEQKYLQSLFGSVDIIQNSKTVILSEALAPSRRACPELAEGTPRNCISKLLLQGILTFIFASIVLHGTTVFHFILLCQGSKRFKIRAGMSGCDIGDLCIRGCFDSGVRPFGKLRAGSRSA